MAYATSADGTAIAYHTVGKGEPIVIVGGAFSTADAATPLAEALAAAGLQGVTLDRRARGSSGDTQPYAPQREAEDLAAVIAAVGGEASVLGHSSGAMLALFAAANGVPVKHLFLSEPPFLFGEGGPGDDFPERLQALLDVGRPEEVVTTSSARRSACVRRSSIRSGAAPCFRRWSRWRSRSSMTRPSAARYRRRRPR